MDEFDVVVVGAGLAGLATARELAARGLSVLCADRKPDVGQGVHTSGIFPRRTLESFSLPDDCLGPAISRVVLHSPRGRSWELRSRRPEFRLGDMSRLYRYMLREAVGAGAGWAPGHRFIGLEFLRSSLIVELRAGGLPRLVRARYLVGADGAKSAVAQALRLDSNQSFLSGLEEVYVEALPAADPALHCFVDPQLAPGYLGWLVLSGTEVRLGVAGLGGRFSAAQSLELLRDRALAALTAAELRDVFRGPPAERRSGLIPVGGMLSRIAHRRGLLVGDAAGAPSPLTAGGLDPCLRTAPWVADLVWGYLRRGWEEPLLGYSGKSFRRQFLARNLMRRGYSHLRSPGLAEAGLAVLAAPLASRIARKVFFGEGSFPNCERLDFQGLAESGGGA